MLVYVNKVSDAWSLEICFHQGDRFFVAERGNTTSLIVARKDFVRIVYETISWWPSVGLPKMYRPLGEIMFAVQLETDECPVCEPIDFLEQPCVATPFSDECAIGFVSEGLTVTLPMEVLVLAFLNEFSERPFLDLRFFPPDFREKFDRRWYVALERLGDREFSGA